MPPTQAPVPAADFATSHEVTKPWTFFSLPRSLVMMETCWIGKPDWPSFCTASSAASMLG